MKTWQKTLITVLICNLWGLITLLFMSWYWPKIPDIFDWICVISCSFSIAIYKSLNFPIDTSEDLVNLIYYSIQIGVYTIIGLVISIVVCKKTNDSARPDP